MCAEPQFLNLQNGCSKSPDSPGTGGPMVTGATGAKLVKFRSCVRPSFPNLLMSSLKRITISFTTISL